MQTCQALVALIVQPPGRVVLDRTIGRADLPEAEVVRPSRYRPVQALHHYLRDSRLCPFAVMSLTLRQMP